MQELINTFFSIKQFPLLLLYSLIFARKQPKRKFFWLTFVGFFVLGTPLFYYAWEYVKTLYSTNAFIWTNVMFYVFAFTLVVAFDWSCFECTFFEAVLYSIGAWTVENMGGSVSIAIGLKAGLSGVIYRDYSVEFFFTFLGASIGAWLFTDGILSLFCKDRKINLDKHGLFVPVITIFVVFVILNGTVSSLFFTEPDKLVYTKYYNIACCILLLSLIVDMFHSGNYRLQIEILEQLDKKQKDQYEMSRDTIEVINTKCHDLKKMLSSTLANGKIMTQEEVERLQEKISIYDRFVQTGNQTLDLVLSEKNLYCEKNEIKLTVMASTVRLDFMSKVDVYSVFANILDNAIEAVMKLEVPKRIISLSVKEVGEFLIIHEDNNYDGNLMTTDGKIQTSKADKTMHGFGLMSIRRVAEKYGGSLKTGTNDNVFHVNVLIPIKK